ncbi:MAG TPA: DUF1440 domain-containing protein [Thermoanaerobaculia bacterium]|jgi:uncharacterized membrane protein YagU involved in acid resistance
MWGLRRPGVWKGLAAGIAGGLVASGTMNLFQAAWTRFEEHNATSRRHTSKRKPREDDATVKAARAISEGLFGHRLTAKQKTIAGPMVHYVFGALAGGLYGVAAERSRHVTSAAGVPFGALFWLTADEIAVPLLRLSKPPDRYPVSKHAYALASHLLYGATTELVRRALRRIL